MDKQETPEDSPPAYDDEVVLPSSSSNFDCPPPPYPLTEPQQFFPPTSPEFPASTGQPTIPYPPPSVYYVGLPQQSFQQLDRQQQVIATNIKRPSVAWPVRWKFMSTTTSPVMGRGSNLLGFFNGETWHPHFCISYCVAKSIKEFRSQILILMGLGLLRAVILCKNLHCVSVKSAIFSLHQQQHTQLHCWICLFYTSSVLSD